MQGSSSPRSSCCSRRAALRPCSSSLSRPCSRATASTRARHRRSRSSRRGARPPYRALGVYVGGTNRACGQANLTPVWVSSVLALGWSLMPLYVGLQAPCVTQGKLEHMSTTPATALTQGKTAADDAAAEVAALGLPTGSPVYADVEGYKLGNASVHASGAELRLGVGAGAPHARLRLRRLRQRRLDDPGRVGEHRRPAGRGLDRRLERHRGRLRRSVRERRPVDQSPADPPVQGRVTTRRTAASRSTSTRTYVDSTVVGGTVRHRHRRRRRRPRARSPSVDGTATVSWPTAAFATQAVVTLTTSVDAAGACDLQRAARRDRDRQPGADRRPSGRP